MFLACYDSEQIKQWLQSIKKAMHFSEWFRNLKEFLSKESDNLTEKFSNKLNEIIQFVEQYSTLERQKIEFIEKPIADTRDRKKNLLRRQEEVFNSMRGSPAQRKGSDEEFKTPDGSFESDEQGMPSPSLQRIDGK